MRYGVPIAAVIAVIAVIAIIQVIRLWPGTQSRGKADAKAARYCTKHVIVKSLIPGGPDRLSWVYGPHRTEGNACDGPEHHRKSGYW